MMGLVMTARAVDHAAVDLADHAVVVVHHAAIHLEQVLGRRQMESLAQDPLVCDWRQLALISSE